MGGRGRERRRKMRKRRKKMEVKAVAQWGCRDGGKRRQEK